MCRLNLVSLALLALVVPGARAAEELAIPLKDQRSTYFLVERSGSDDKPVLLLKRVSASGTRYVKRAFDCHARTTMQAGYGESVAGLEKSAPATAMRALRPNSVSEQLWHYACKR